MISSRLDQLASRGARRQRPSTLMSLTLFTICLASLLLLVSSEQLFAFSPSSSPLSPPVSPLAVVAQREAPPLDLFVQEEDEEEGGTTPSPTIYLPPLEPDGEEDGLAGVQPQTDDGVEEDGEEGSVHALPKEQPPSSVAATTAAGENAATGEMIDSIYLEHYLPKAQLNLFPFRNRHLPPIAIKFQMHNCLRGRDGSKIGLRENGIPLVQLQRHQLDNMPLHYVDPASSVILSCNSKVPVHRLSRDGKANGKRLISTAQGLLAVLCLGSTKSRQLECRRDLASHWGCDYESLQLQPRQYILSEPRECNQFLLLNQDSGENASWLSKPSGGIRGRGIKYFATTTLLQQEIKQLGGCLNSNTTGLRGRIAQEYVSQPALLDGKYKFDCRTWLLIASVDPLLIFYHEGFVRVARQAYNAASTSKMVHITNAFGQLEAAKDEENKYMRSFGEINPQLAKTYGLPEDYMHGLYRKQMMRSMAFAALSQFQLENRFDPQVKKRGFYQIYACDSVVDAKGRAHLLECNGFPAESQQATVTGKKIWEEMIALLLNLHLEPWNLLRADSAPPATASKFQKKGVWERGPDSVENGHKLEANKYVFGGWHLVFNELETPTKSFNVCSAFAP
ncbi:hypothetical protein BASA81_004787 [Batrachochytrium salamandrivorans]|nr:hypothetical protein BASA81_004787 [Batrachochytrium salamandrivorans]